LDVRRPASARRYLNSFPRPFPVARPAALRAMRLPTHPLRAAWKSPRNFASKYKKPRVLVIVWPAFGRARVPPQDRVATLRIEP
jgi:hypothetical protein